MTEPQPSSAQLLAFALELADAADQITMQYFRGEPEVRAKADRSLVTRADEEAEAYLRQRIAERFPDHAVLGEEQGFTAGGADGARWILDPVDGTHGYARGLPVWGTLIALERHGTVEIGVASAPALGTRWWGARGFGAYRAAVPGNGHAGERIHVSSVASLAESQLLYGSYRALLETWPASDALLRSAWRTRGLGDFWCYCLVAEGAAEAMLEPTISPWDIAALLVIVEEAGGRLTDLDGRTTIDAGHCIASNGAVHDQVLGALRGAGPADRAAGGRA